MGRLLKLRKAWLVPSTDICCAMSLVLLLGSRYPMILQVPPDIIKYHWWYPYSWLRNSSQEVFLGQTDAYEKCDEEPSYAFWRLSDSNNLTKGRIVAWNKRQNLLFRCGYPTSTCSIYKGKQSSTHSVFGTWYGQTFFSKVFLVFYNKWFHSCPQKN